MSTIKLFQEDVYLQEADSQVLEILPLPHIDGKSQSFNLILDRTVFFPTGGGQPCDLGTINGFQVVDVSESSGNISHVIELPPGETRLTIAIGDTVDCRLDWPRRFDNMQRHCGEHILSGMFFRAFKGVNHGFHMGDEYMTIDILLPKNSDYPSITWEMAMSVEMMANSAIWDDAPVITRKYNSKEDAAGLPLRKPLAIHKDITIVCVGDTENPSDCVACCGTHPKTAGEVGLIKILKLESYKGMTRIYFEAGRRALLDYDMKHDLIGALNAKFSASTVDLMDKLALHDEKNKALRSEFHLLKQSVVRARISSIEAELDAPGGIKDSLGQLNILVKEYDDMKAEDLMNIGRPLMDKIKGLLLIISASENTLLLFSDGKIHCGKLVKENASIYNGKGGGQSNNARALFPNREYLDTFIDLIEKHLR